MIKKFRFFAFFPLLIFSFYFNACFAQGDAPDLNQTIEASQEDKISLDIKGMDIVDVLKTLAMRSGMNIVVGKNVLGKVTIFLKDVKPRQALDIILLANDLAYDEHDGIINVMSGRDYEARYGEKFADLKDIVVVKLQHAKSASVTAALNQIKSQIGKVVVDESSNTVILMDVKGRLDQMRQMLAEIDRPTQTRVFDLDYSNSDKLNTKISEMVTKTIGSVTVDERTNKIVIVDYPEKIEQITKMIEAFDSQTRQVLIDSKIVEITLDDKTQLGIDWDYWIKEHFRINDVFNLGLTTGGTLTLGTTTITKPNDFKTVIQLLSTIGDTRVLSSPRVTAINNQEAKILVGTKEAYITQTTSQSGTGSTITAESVNFVDVGIQLYVTPTINKKGFVTMKIKPVVSSAVSKDIKSADTVSSVPIVSTSEAETTVMVQDGSTIIIAGLIKDEVNKTVNKIPLLGDIPFLGNLFKNTTNQVKKKELVIFLTPHILSTSLAETKEVSLEFEESMKFLKEYKKPEPEAIEKLKTGKNGLIKENEVSLDLSYFEYLSELRKIISEKSGSMLPKDFIPGDVEVAFLLDSNGKLKNYPQIVSSSNDSLKDYALKAVIASSPFPPFPKALAKEEERFDVVISYSK
jgi:MSHA type pilus biogenesis protein MshL